MGPGRINKVVEHVDCITQHDGGRIYFFQVRIIGKVSYFNIIYLAGSYLIVCWHHRPEPRVRFHCQAGRGLTVEVTVAAGGVRLTCHYGRPGHGHVISVALCGRGQERRCRPHCVIRD